MPTLRYWDKVQGAYIQAPAIQGAQGPVGTQGALGLFPVDTINPALQNVFTGAMPPAGTRIKFCFTHGTATPDSTGKFIITFSTYGWTFQYGYIPVLTGAILPGGTATGFTAVETGSSPTQLTVYAFNGSGGAITTAVHFMLWVVGA